MTKALNKRIADAFGKIYDMGDSGLDYMDKHDGLAAGLMEHFYNDTLEQLTRKQLTKLAEQLEQVADDMAFDLEVC